MKRALVGAVLAALLAAGIPTALAQTGVIGIFDKVYLRGLTASRLVATDANKASGSVTDLSAWVSSGTGVTVANDGDGTVTLNLATLADGGTGTFLKLTRDTYGRLSGTTAVVAGDITGLIGTPTLALTGTALEVLVNGGVGPATGNITLTSPLRQVLLGSTDLGADWLISTGRQLRMSDPDVAHGMTAVFPTDVYAAALSGSGTAGGLQLVGLTDTDAIGAYLFGIIGTATPSATTPAIQLRGSKKNGTGVQALAAGDLLAQFNNNGTAGANVYGDGGINIISGGLTVGYSETPQADQVRVGDPSFQLQWNGTNPLVVFDNTDYLIYSRSSNNYQFIIANVTEMLLDASGLQITDALTLGAGTGADALGIQLQNSGSNYKLARFDLATDGSGSGTGRRVEINGHRLRYLNSGSDDLDANSVLDDFWIMACDGTPPSCAEPDDNVLGVSQYGKSANVPGAAVIGSGALAASNSLHAGGYLVIQGKYYGNPGSGASGDQDWNYTLQSAPAGWSGAAGSSRPYGYLSLVSNSPAPTSLTEELARFWNSPVGGANVLWFTPPANNKGYLGGTAPDGTVYSWSGGAFAGLVLGASGSRTQASDELRFYDSDVAHGMTTVFPTDVYGAILSLSGTAGGIQVVGVSDTDAAGAYLLGIIGTATPSATTPATVLRGAKKNGTGVQALAAGDLLAQFNNNGTAGVNVYGDGGINIISGGLAVGFSGTPVAGTIAFAERADPAAPSANFAYIYAKDNGAGKTQMCARFNTGAVQCFATEP